MSISSEEEADELPSPADAALNVLEQIQKDIVDLIKQQVSKIKIHVSSGRPLTAPQSVMLTRFISTLNSLKPPPVRNPKGRTDNEQLESEFAEQLSGMSKKEVLKMLLPYLEDLGFDIASIKFNKHALKESQDESTADPVQGSG